MIYRKILRCKTSGSKESKDLQPILADHLPSGVCLSALEYGGDTCIVELHCSDHNMLPVDARRNKQDLDVVAVHPSVIEVLTGHPLSPNKLMTLQFDYASLTGLNKEKKEAVYHGRRGSYIRLGERGIVADEG